MKLEGERRHGKFALLFQQWRMELGWVMVAKMSRRRRSPAAVVDIFCYHRSVPNGSQKMDGEGQRVQRRKGKKKKKKASYFLHSDYFSSSSSFYRVKYREEGKKVGA